VRRIDGVLGFAHLSSDASQDIARALLSDLCAVLRTTYTLDCGVTDAAIRHLASLGRRDLGVSPHTRAGAPPGDAGAGCLSADAVAQADARRIEQGAPVARRALNPDPSWWCATCRAGRAGHACSTCGLLRELAPRDPGLRPQPVIEDVEARGFIISEVMPRERLPGWEWPWHAYFILGLAIVVILRWGLLNVFGQWLLAVLAVAFLGFVVLARFRRQALQAFGARCLSRLRRRERFRHLMNVEHVDDHTTIEVSIDAPRP
jgi:hypothetical protein